MKIELRETQIYFILAFCAVLIFTAGISLGGLIGLDGGIEEGVKIAGICK